MEKLDNVFWYLEGRDGSKVTHELTHCMSYSDGFTVRHYGSLISQSVVLRLW